MNNIVQNNQVKYFICLEPLYTQGVGEFYMITTDKNYGEIFRQELLKYKNYIVDTFNDLVGWIFYENIYKIINITQVDDDVYEYTLEEIHSYEYEPSKYNNSKMKKVKWEKKIKNKNYITRDDKLLKENYVYNTINSNVSEINLISFNILLWNNNRTNDPNEDNN